MLTLKNEQLSAIRAVYERKDVFVWLPTGFGKSLCYQALPFVVEYKMSLAGSCTVVPQVYRLRRFCRKSEVRVGTTFQSVINVTNTSGEFLGSVSAEAQDQLRNGAIYL